MRHAAKELVVTLALFAALVILAPVCWALQLIERQKDSR